MAEIKMTATFEYDENQMHGHDPEAIKWFMGILQNNLLLVHENEIGDMIGCLKNVQLEKGQI